MATMRDVAALAGVSLSTVASVINENKFVSSERKKRVEEAMLRLDYQKKTAAKVSNENEIAVILPGIGSSFFPPLLNGISDIANTKQFTVSLYDSGRSFHREEQILKSCAEKGVRNMILDSVCDINHEKQYFAELQKTMVRRYGIRLVVVERKLSMEGLASIYVDNYAASYEVTQHLIELGCRHLVHIGGASVFPNTKTRQDAFVQALFDHNMEPNPLRMLRGDFTPLSGYGLMQEMLDKGITMDGVFAANDQMAIGAMKALIASGCHIPDDIAVAGFDNLAISSVVSPGLTTVQFPIYQMGAQAVGIIAGLRDGNSTNMDVKLESKLIVRGSTQPGAKSDWTLHGW